MQENDEIFSKKRSDAPRKARLLAQHPGTLIPNHREARTERLFPETPAAGQPAEDLRQFCEEHKM